jgi:hypothetical protein
MAQVGKKKRKKKKRSIRVGAVGLGGKRFSQSSFKESDKYSLTSLTEALKKVIDEREERVQRVAQRFPELELQARRVDPVQPLRGKGAFRVREGAGGEDDRTQDLTGATPPKAELIATAPVITDKPIPRRQRGYKDADDGSTVTSGNVSSVKGSGSVRDQRYMIDEEGNIQEEDSLDSGFRGSLGGRSRDSSSILDPTERRYKREDMGFWGGQIIKNFAAARGITVPLGVTLQKGTPEREQVLDQLFQDSRRKGIL